MPVPVARGHDRGPFFPGLRRGMRHPGLAGYLAAIALSSGLGLWLALTWTGAGGGGAGESHLKK